MAVAAAVVPAVSSMASVGRDAQMTPDEEFVARAKVQQQLVVVSCYTRFDNLAHGPKGTEAKHSLYTFQMNPQSGEMVLLSVAQEPTMNPAFSRWHPKKNVLYTCTESVAENGSIDSWSVCPTSGKLAKIGSCDAGGTSTCYLFLDRELENMLVVNYWDATIGVFGMHKQLATVQGLKSRFDPKGGKAMRVSAGKHVNHSINDEAAQKERMLDPHSHAVILDPFFGRVAYVPDLGMNLVRQFKYDPVTGTLRAAGSFKCGPDGRKALGPRYIEFHPTLPFAYVINELASEVAVFEFDRKAAEDLVNSCLEDASGAMPTLRLVQSARTVPEAFPNEMNTCGRITVHQGGHFVLVSNRGHDSISVFRVHHTLPHQGKLTLVHVEHTRGATPRHFQFDTSGQWLIAANQDTDSIDVFMFNLATGKLDWTGNKYRVPSPNFVCALQPHLPDGVSVPPARL